MGQVLKYVSLLEKLQTMTLGWLWEQRTLEQPQWRTADQHTPSLSTWTSDFISWLMRWEPLITFGIFVISGGAAKDPL